GALLSPHQILPDEGAFVGWRFWSGRLFKFEIPAQARRCNSIGDRMGRADRVRILAVWDQNGDVVPFGADILVTGLTLRLDYDGELVSDRYSDDPRDSRPVGIPFYL